MSASLSPLSRRTSIAQCQRLQVDLQQVRHATLIKRPKRPYTFTQLVTLSDGSSYLHRTTSPVPVYRATKDVRNTPLWNPSSRKLLSIEDDEAGKLAGFRSRFGSSWDSEVDDEEANVNAGKKSDASKAQNKKDGADNLFDMIGNYSNKAFGGTESQEASKTSKDGKK